MCCGGRRRDGCERTRSARDSAACGTLLLLFLCLLLLHLMLLRSQRGIAASLLVLLLLLLVRGKRRRVAAAGGGAPACGILHQRRVCHLQRLLLAGAPRRAEDCEDSLVVDLEVPAAEQRKVFGQVDPRPPRQCDRALLEALDLKN